MNEFFFYRYSVFAGANKREITVQFASMLHSTCGVKKNVNFTTAITFIHVRIGCCLFDMSINRLLLNLKFCNEAGFEIFMASKKQNCWKSEGNVKYFGLRNRKIGVSLIICQWLECDNFIWKWVLLYVYFYANKACFISTIKTKTKKIWQNSFLIHAQMKMNDYTDSSLDFTAHLPVNISKLES